MLWEFFSLAKVPYPGMEVNQGLYNTLRNGYRMEKPQYANQDIYEIMLNCWKVNPNARPSFTDLKNQFSAMLPEEMRNHYIALNEPYLAMNTEREQRGETDYLASMGPPEEQAPPAPSNYVNGIIFTMPANNQASDLEENDIDIASYKNSQLSPTFKVNLNTSLQQHSKWHKKKGIPEEIPMLCNHNRRELGFSSDLESKATRPVPMVRTTKMNCSENEYTNIKQLDRPTEKLVL